MFVPSVCAWSVPACIVLYRASVCTPVLLAPVLFAGAPRAARPHQPVPARHAVRAKPGGPAKRDALVFSYSTATITLYKYLMNTSAWAVVGLVFTPQHATCCGTALQCCIPHERDVHGRVSKFPQGLWVHHRRIPFGLGDLRNKLRDGVSALQGQKQYRLAKELQRAVSRSPLFCGRAVLATLLQGVTCIYCVWPKCVAHSCSAR